ncbi:MAG: endonuclease NucS [Oscillospiraceae bacterium]|nr:endonuclease NucS [Oscillospiraceae bacterium]
MAFSQTVWSLDEHGPLMKGKLLEKELENLLYEHVELLNPEWLVIGRQISTPAGPLDMLCMEYGGGLIVVELKKDKTPRQVTAQVIDYASCVDGMTIDELSEIFLNQTNGKLGLAEAYQQKYGIELDEESISDSVKMVIVAAEMDASTERIVTYLNDKHGIGINILFFQVFQDGERRYISRAWLQEEQEEPHQVARVTGKWNNEFYVSFGEKEEGRSWSDAVKYGFISGGGGTWYSKTLKQLKKGDRVWVNIPHTGYVGVGYVSEEAKVAKDVHFFVNGKELGFQELQTEGSYLYSLDNNAEAEYVVKVDWIKTIASDKAVKELGFFGNQNTVCRPLDAKWDFTVNRLKVLWNIGDSDSQ